ncbi:MAG TPA: hypothetical protein VLH59_14000 [Ignavibacteriaceae bacterium]|nr:hypothetical protein [Ignavibacteriaceae bacterium]
MIHDRIYTHFFNEQIYHDAAKAGTTEGYRNELLGIKAKSYSSLFTQEEIVTYFSQAGFLLEFFDKRNPYDFEISNERIFAIGKKV